MQKTVEASPIANPLKRTLILGLSTAGGVGYAPVAPGTFGSLVGIPLGLILLQYPGWMGAIVLAILVMLTAPIVERACKHWGVMDSGRVVWDEVLGQAIALLGLRSWVLAQKEIEPGFVFPPILGIIIAFLAFRVFDIFKPFPAKSFDRKPSGLGVILDDVVAGLYAALLMASLLRIGWID